MKLKVFQLFDKTCEHKYEYRYYDALTDEEYYKCSLCGKTLVVKVKLFDEWHEEIK